MIDLATIDQVLSILVKTVFLLIFGFTVLLLRKLDDVIESAERSAESIEHTAETVESIISIAEFLPMIGGKRKKARNPESDNE
ncbi:MAG: hypothetical protein ABEJ93_02335 [Candidatus Nanohalobium sp.]